MEKLANYFNHMYGMYDSEWKCLPKHEIDLLINVVNNINVDNLLNNALSGQFYNYLGIMMEDRNMYNCAKKYY